MSTLRPLSSSLRSVPPSPEEHSNLQAKIELAYLHAEAGLHMSARKLASWHGVAPPTYRGWMKRSARDRRPPESALQRVRDFIAEQRRARKVSGL